MTKRFDRAQTRGSRVNLYVVGVVLAMTSAVWREHGALAAPPPGHFMVMSDGTVLDTATDLRWQQLPETAITFAQAREYCAALALGGVQPGTWRTPSIRELLTIVDWEGAPAIHQATFPGESNSGGFWSSTEPYGSLNDAYIANFSLGGFSVNPTDSPAAVRCVR